jgi:hypothetical protein
MAKSAAEFLGLWFRWDQWRSAMLGWMQSYDLMLCPVCATPALPHWNGWPHAARLQLCDDLQPDGIARGGRSRGDISGVAADRCANRGIAVV